MRVLIGTILFVSIPVACGGREAVQETAPAPSPTATTGGGGPVAHINFYFRSCDTYSRCESHPYSSNARFHSHADG